MDERILSSSDLPIGRYLRIEIEERDAGIPEEIRNRIFEVSFTAKPRGSRLGLATVKSIVHEHGGSITIKSLVGRGTIVSILLPAAAHRLEPPAASFP
jgi:signal transduction histidine kinase